MKSLSVLFSLICIVCSVTAQVRQIGGADASVAQYPFMAAIAFARKLVGNGAIFAPRWILTSASAVHAPQDILFDVQVGADSFMGTGSWHEVLQILRHPEFVGWDYNIALIQLKGPITYSDTVQPIVLGTQDKNYLEVIMVSYGINEEGTEHLREAAYTLSADDECVAFLTEGLAKEMITNERGYCVLPYRGAEQGQWFNDAGAPIVANNQLYGVFAFAEHEGGINQGSVATRLISFADWIQSTMQAHS